METCKNTTWNKFVLVLFGYCVSILLISVSTKDTYILSSFYGINLNQNVVLQQIGFDGAEGTPWEKLFKIATGNLIITALGFVPGKFRRIFGYCLSEFVC